MRSGGDGGQQELDGIELMKAVAMLNSELSEK
jgi:hypothetical protein